jgi:hypothetical protein
VDVTVLAIPQCQGAALLDERLAAAVSGLPGIHVTRQIITTQQEAAAAGMCGSPTLLVDGTDPFAQPGQQPSLSCRLYWQADGSLSGAPQAGELRQALAAGSPP